MTEHELFHAIGAADEKYLLELEQPRVRRLPRQAGLIAAVFALVLTACAAPELIRSFDKLENGDIMESYSVQLYNDHGDVRKTLTFSKTVSLEVQVDPNAPDTIEEYAIPLTILEYCTIEDYTISDSIFSLELSTNIPKYGTVYGGVYQQRVLPSDGKIEVDDFLESGIWNPVNKTYGDISVLELNGDTSYRMSDGTPLYSEKGTVVQGFTRHIFWSDGFYLYCLKLLQTDRITYDKVESIVTSLTQVEDISEYLPTAE